MNGISNPHRIGPALGPVPWVTLLVVFLSACWCASAQPQKPQQLQIQKPQQLQIQKPLGIIIEGKVDFPFSLVPKIPANLPIMKLTVQAPPVLFLQESLGKIGIQKNAIQQLSRVPSLAQRHIPEQVMGVVEQDRIRALWHPQTGESEIHPQMQLLKTERFVANTPRLAAASALAKTIFARPDILPKDATQFTIGDAIPLIGVTAQKGANGAISQGEPMHYLSYVPVHRQVQGFPVMGTGSRALVGVDNAGTLQAFSLRWKAGNQGGTAREGRSPQQIHDALNEVIKPLARKGDVTVLSVGIVYYDDEGDAMPPVYRITARAHTNPGAGQKAGSDDLVVLYAPFGSAPLPAGLNGGGEQPQESPANRGALESVQAEIPEGDPTVGRYVVRNDNHGWVDNANGFWNGLMSSGGGSLFTNSQYYWAHPFEFTTNANSFVNSVQIGVVEAHGDWWYFTTYQNWGEGVNLDSNPAPGGGYGQVNNHGHLNHLILHGCEDVPSAAEAPCPAGMPTHDARAWWDPWFRIFQGLHTVVGYRTVMYINDNVGQGFGTSIRNGTPILSAWSHALLTAGDYHSKPRVIAHCGANPAAHLNPGDGCPSSSTPGCLVMGQPSAVAVCGHENDTIYNEENIPAAGCLINFWWWNN